MLLRKSFRVWRKYKPRSVLMESREIPDQALLFEARAIAILSPVEVDILRKECNYSDSVSAYGCLGVLSVDFEHVTFQYLVLVTECQSVGKLQDAEIFRITQATFIPLSRRAKLELVQELSKLLSSGQFYFSYPSYGANFDLLSCAQKQGTDQPHFFWNRSLLTFMKRFGVDCSKWLFRIMCGSVDIQTIYGGDKQAKLVLISRLSCERAGTRFNVRGMNDEGHVANFAETEQAIYVDNNIVSFVQIRGLVPLFWDQPGLQTGGGILRIKFSRGYNCSKLAFERHFEWCLLHYGPQFCLNLLGQRDQEMMLSNAFQEHLSQLSSAYCTDMTCFDFHRVCRGSSSIENTLSQKLLPSIESFLSAHGFYVNMCGKVERRQTGTIRTNCLDCLDRTNSAQAFLGQEVLLQLLSTLDLPLKQTVTSRFKQQLTSAWNKNGDSLSQLYAGTRALRQEGKTSKLQAGARSVQRTIRNNFMDNTKQEAFDMLLFNNAFSGDLGQKARSFLERADAFAPVPFKKAVSDRWGQFTSSEKLRVCIGTWNVNGGKHIRSIALKNQSTTDWLLDGPSLSGMAKEHPEEFKDPPDIYAIGFEELVGLTASNIVSASSSNRKEWGMELQKVLSRDTPYELLTAEQLVGVCLYVFIRPKLIPHIRDVAVRSVKTGMSGTAGNKGGVAIRFLLQSTSLCFVCSHFAAHQTKVVERNQDFADIFKRITFPGGQTLDSHDYIFWTGDLNYRVDLPTPVAKDYITNKRYDKLMKHDQLKKQKKLRKVFKGFVEGDLNFDPTYKYDEFSDDYDTSEKGRTPAWCDRILWKRRSWADRSKTSRLSPRPSNYLAANGDDSESSNGKTSHDFGLHPSDAEQEVGSLMGTGGAEDELITTGHEWHPGRLLYYNRSELKQSDHRPVVALIEVDIYRVDKKKRAEIREEVATSLGPPDPTVLVQEKEERVCVSIPQLLETFRKFGDVVLVRVTDDAILVTFKKSTSAVTATSVKEIGGVEVEVSLRCPWPPGSDVTEASIGTSLLRNKRDKGDKAVKSGRRLTVLNMEQLGFVGDEDEDDNDAPDQEVGVSSHLDSVAEDQEVVDLEQEEGGDQAGLASSSSSEGDLELQTASSSSPQSHSKSRSVPPKPAVPRQRPVIPPRPKETTASNSEGLEPTPFDYTDPFQAYENREKSAQSSKEQKPSPPQITAKPSRPPTMKKPQQSVDASTSSASSVTSEQTTAAQSKSVSTDASQKPATPPAAGERPVPAKRKQTLEKQNSPPLPGGNRAASAESAKKQPPQRPSKPPPARPPPPKRT